MKTLRSATLWPVIPIALFFIYLVGCKKDTAAPPIVKPELTVEEAMRIFLLNNQSHQIGAGSYRTDSIETESNEPLIVPDWSNAAFYNDELRQIAVVEVPILANHLAKILLVAENSAIDSSFIDESIQVNKLVFTQDTGGAISYAIMKINGTPDYLASHNINENSFRGVESEFDGRLAYYDFTDSLLTAYLIQDGVFYEALSPRDTGETTTAQERWGFCVDHYEYRPCTGDNHTWEQRAICNCGKTASCIPPQRIAILVECGGSLATNGGTSGCCVPPPPPPPGNTGGAPGPVDNQNPSICFIQNVYKFDSIYGTQLLNDYEEQTQACIDLGCSASFNDFKTCVFDEIAASLPEPPAPPNNPPISVARPICSQILNFEYFVNPIAPHNQFVAMVLENAYIQLAAPGSAFDTIYIQNLRFEIYANANTACLVDAPVFAANALNLAVLRVQTYINNLPLGTSKNRRMSLASLRLLSETRSALENNVKNCNTAYDIGVSNSSYNTNGAPTVNCDAEMANCQ